MFPSGTENLVGLEVMTSALEGKKRCYGLARHDQLGWSWLFGQVGSEIIQENLSGLLSSSSKYLF